MADFAARLLPLGRGDPHADVVLVDHPIAETEWAFGIAGFSRGLALIGPNGRNRHTAKHETARLMGYTTHDDKPLFVLGYPWEGWPWNRNTLMMLLSSNDELSPRARDAIRAFWRRLERKTDMQFLRTPDLGDADEASWRKKVLQVAAEGLQGARNLLQ